MSNRLSDDALRQAAAKLRDARLAMQPSPEECKHEFSPQFEQAMNVLMHRGRRRGQHRVVWHRIATVAASLFLVFLLGVSTTLAVSQEARTAVVSWLREQYENSIIYRFWGSGDAEKFPSYRVGWMPDGFELVQETEFENLYAALYQSTDGKTHVAFSYVVNDEENEVHIWGNADGSEWLAIQDMRGEYVPSEDGKSGDLIWIDENRQIVFTLSSELKKSTTIDIAESVFLVK